MGWLIGIGSGLIFLYLIFGGIAALYVTTSGEAFSLKMVFLWLPIIFGWVSP